MLISGWCAGLFIDFELTSLSVNGNPAQPTLTADFGDIPAQESVVAVWFLTSTLQGSFTNFEATFSFVNPLGIPEAGLDIIDSLEVMFVYMYIYVIGEGKKNETI